MAGLESRSLAGLKVGSVLPNRFLNLKNPTQILRLLEAKVSGAIMQEILVESSCRQAGVTDVELVAYI